jgi:hypothetical protein
MPTNVPTKTGLKSSTSGPFRDPRQPEQTAAFSLSATSPQTLSEREISLAGSNFSLEPATVFKPAASGEFSRE